MAFSRSRVARRGVNKYSLRDIRRNQSDFRASTRYARRRGTGHYRRWLAP